MTYRFPNHPLGVVFANEEHRTAYLNIPKCASTATKLFLKEYGFDGKQTSKMSDWKNSDWTVFTILRDPFGRYVSGLAEYAKRKDYDPIMVAKKAADLMDRGLWEPFDEHTVPQHAFLTVPINIILPINNVPLGVPEVLRERGFDIPSDTEVEFRRVTDLGVLQRIETIVKDSYRPDPVDHLLWSLIN